MNQGNKDVMVHVPGGLRITEPAIDLAVALSIASSYLETSIDPLAVVLGEVGLNGEIRSIPHLERRLNEAVRHGFNKALVPRISTSRITKIAEMDIIGVDGVAAAIAQATSVNLRNP